MADSAVPPPVTPAPAAAVGNPGSGKRTALIAALLIIILALAIAVAFLLGRNSNAPASTAVVPRASATTSASASPHLSAAPTVAAPTPAAPTACGPFDTPLPALDPGSNGTPTGFEGAGCDNGQVPASGAGVSLASGWVLVDAYTCNGDSGPGGMGDEIDFIAHNTVTGVDLPPMTGSGPWATGVTGATTDGSPSPAGHYVIRAQIVHPGVNHCQWHISVYTGAVH